MVDFGFEVSKELQEKQLMLLEKLKKGGKIKVGVNEATKMVERGTAKLVIIAKDVQPLELVMHLPLICREKNIIFHVDAVQALTKVKIDVKKQNIDLLSMSAHKIHGPKGVGALYVKKGIKLKKLFDGGSQESKLRAGTENIPGIAGFAKAIKIADKKDIKNMIKLRDKLIDGCLKIGDCWLNGSREKRLCNNANISFRYIEGEALGGYLDVKGICSSTGSACSSTSLKPSHVLTALGLKPEEAHGSIRLTLSKHTTEDEIDYTIKILEKNVKKLRRMSPLFKNV